MNIYPFESFVYLIGWTSQNRFYIGSRYCKTAHPSQLWTSYFTSSKIVKEFRVLNGEPDVIMVIKVFDSGSKAHSHETSLLRRLQAVKSDRWLNQTDNVNFRIIGPFSEEHCRNISLSKKGENNSNYGKIVITDGIIERRIPKDCSIPDGWNRGRLRDAWNKGKEMPSISEESRKKISESMKNRVFTNEHRLALSKARSGCTVSKETRQKLRELNTGKNNPNYGKIIITDGISERRIPKDDLIPSGWKRGRPKS